MIGGWGVLLLHRKRVRAALLAGSAAALAGCGLLPQISGGGGRGAPGADAAAVWRDDVRLVVAGVLAEPDAPRETVPQCPVVILDDGRIYALIGDLGGAGPGDRVELTGPPAAWSTCQTYQVLRADRVDVVQAWAGR
ncbi:hypothetical protein ABIE65_003552 [Constrictibacter sp. MBR-5]